MSIRYRLLIGATAMLGLALSSSEASTTIATDYPTTCQWNNCPDRPPYVCLLTETYVCFRP